jgi:hypothetical protein
MAYSDLLKDRRWQRKRLEAMSSAQWLCQRCPSNDNAIALHVHHMDYVPGRAPWEYELRELLVVCEPCHKELHGMRETDVELCILYQAIAEAHRTGRWNDMKEFADEAMRLIGEGYYYRRLV